MKHEKWLPCLIGAVLGFCIGVAGVGCIVTAFHLEPVNMAAVMGLCALCTAAVSVCFTLRRGFMLLLAAAALLIGYLIRERTLLVQLEALVCTVSRFYDQAYGWGVLRWTDGNLEGVSMTGALAVISILIAAAVSWTVCRRQLSVLAIGLGFLPLAACFVVTDTVPRTGWIWLLLAGFAMLLLTQPVRRRSAADGCRLTAMLTVPVMLVSMLLFYVHPRERYDIQTDSVQQTLLSWLDGFSFVVMTPEGELTISLDGAAASQIDLSDIGPKTRFRYAVMDVVSENSGMIYLRGQSLDSYDGISWTASEFSTGEDLYFPTGNMKKTGTVRISLRSAQRQLYVPYYLSDGYTFREGRIENEEALREYSYSVMTPVEGLPHLAVDYQQNQLQHCLQLPETVRTEARQLLQDEVLASGTVSGSNATAARVQAIADYVRGSARYDLNTQRMPEDEQDFALWFLQESETGYCVHYATAAAVLLRAAGIPARYVTGYAFQAQAGTRVTVRADKAHAWVEYLDPDTGWTVLDATPGQWMDGETPEPTQKAPEPTQIPATQPVDTEPTQTRPADTQPSPTEPEQTLPDETVGTPGPGEGPPAQQPERNIGWLRTVLWVVLWCAGIAAALLAQYWLRLRSRSRKMHTGKHNRRALARWREVLRLAKLTKLQAPQRLEELAEKAKFSQHTLTAAELREFDIWLEEAGKVIADRPWPVRLMIRLIWAI